MNSFGLYIHVPFCKTKCSYCGFYSVTSNKLQNQYVDTLLKEMNSEAGNFQKASLKTIYIGGGTPSILSVDNLKRIVNDGIKNYWSLQNIEEFTVEVNPDDVTPEFLVELKQLGVNRVSMGMQCLDDSILKIINRRHTALVARRAVDMLKEQFDNVSLDYIYGLPNQSVEIVKRDVEELLNMNIQHLSIYALSVEENSILDKQIQKGIISLPDDDIVVEQYNAIVDLMAKYNWRHYEVSNYVCDDKHLAKHNSNYWIKVPYLGLGPAASSYDGDKRRWTNTENISDYLSGNITKEEDILSDDDIVNERIMLGLRTDSGINIAEFNPQMQKLISNNNDLVEQNGIYKIPEKKWMIYNTIVSSLFV